MAWTRGSRVQNIFYKSEPSGRWAYALVVATVGIFVILAAMRVVPESVLLPIVGWVLVCFSGYWIAGPYLVWVLKVCLAWGVLRQGRMFYGTLIVTDGEGRVLQYWDVQGQKAQKSALSEIPNVFRNLCAQAAQDGVAISQLRAFGGQRIVRVHAIWGLFLWTFEDTQTRDLNRIWVSQDGKIKRTEIFDKTLRQKVNELKFQTEGSTLNITNPYVIDPYIAIISPEFETEHQVLFVGQEATLSWQNPKVHQDFDRLPVAMVSMTPQGDILRLNEHACRLLGVRAGEVRKLQDIMTGLGRSIGDWLSDAARGKGLSQLEFLRLTRLDKETFVQVSLNKIEENGKPALIAVLTDATELKTLEAQFVQSQKMQAIGQLAGGVAHDFNNLLTAISGHCDLMLLRCAPENQDYADLVQIHQNANRAAALVSQLLAFSRKQTLQPQSLDIRETLSDLTHLLNRLVGEKVRLDLQHSPDMSNVRADKRQLEQVFMNLVVNARDAMAEGGVISIQSHNITFATSETRDRVRIPAGDYICISVRDTGHGISPDKLQKVFEPFYTTKRTGEGTGLGLSTVYGIIKQTGGYVFVESQEGVGTEFTIYLPAVAKALPAFVDAKPAVKPKDKAVASGVVLLVEDEAPVRTFAARALQLRGLQVVEADCAEEALRLLQDDDLKIDIFVTDVVMPGRDGPSWVKEALEHRPDAKVVFMSGYAEDGFENDQAEIQGSVFLPKPFSLQDLTQTVAHQLSL